MDSQFNPQNDYPQNDYQYPAYHDQGPPAPVMSVKDWLIVSLIMMVPLVNIIMLFIWGFDRNTNPNKSNWAKATLLMQAIALGLAFLIIFLVLIISLSV